MDIDVYGIGEERETEFVRWWRFMTMVKEKR